jgi:hypothetical protein
MKDDRLERQIEQFYANVPNVEDALPLKDFLLKHENNQMAWYLLGKQYAERGEAAKAAYCFSNAGPVYEAFEGKPAPVPAEAERAAAGRGGAMRLAAALAALLLAGTALFAGRAAAPASGDGAAVAGPASAVASPLPQGGGTGAGAGAEAAGKGAGKDAGPPGAGYAAVAGAAAPDDAGRRALGSLLAAYRGPGLLVQAPLLQQWTDWLRSGRPVAAVVPAAETGTAAVNWYDPQWCGCRAQDGAAAVQAAAAWKPEQEYKLALRSAIVQYKARTGRWPTAREQLAGAYPDNTMAGWHDGMTAWLQELTGDLTRVDGRIPAVPGWPAAAEDSPEAARAAPAGAFAPLAEQPLEIIVDKLHHRLAVVSGGVLLRNYPVGLGGDKTPEGVFTITEKVRNPNGRSDGEYGSRGMTLSGTLYAIHGTDEPDSIGKDESHGCIRMRREDLEELYDLVPLGTKVTIEKKGLPSELRIPPERFRLEPLQNETNPGKTYEWL